MCLRPAVRLLGSSEWLRASPRTQERGWETVPSGSAGAPAGAERSEVRVLHGGGTITSFKDDSPPRELIPKRLTVQKQMYLMPGVRQAYGSRCFPRFGRSPLKITCLTFPFRTGNNVTYRRICI